MENRKKSIEELQAELTLEAEALSTLQLIYAEKVKQVRVNTLLPPDIQARFLSEWETFYQQRMTALFRKSYLLEGSGSNVNSGSLPPVNIPSTATPPTPVAIMPMAPPVPVMPTPSYAAPAPVMPPVSSPVAPIPSNRPIAPSIPNPPVMAPLPTPVAPTPPIAQVKRNDPPPPPPPPSMPVPPAMPSMPMNSESTLTDDILGVNTGSWMNPAESIGYEQYSDSEPISSTLMDSDKIQSSDNDMDSDYEDDLDDESDSIDGFAATSGLKGLTEFMDFDLKRKKS